MTIAAPSAETTAETSATLEHPRVPPAVRSQEGVRAWLWSMIRAMQFEALIKTILGLIDRLQAMNLELTRKIAAHRSKPRSERGCTVSGQYALPGFELTPPARKPRAKKDPAVVADPKDGAKDDAKDTSRDATVSRFPAELRREEQPNPVPESERLCPRCGRPMEHGGYTTCEYLEVRPSEIFVAQRKDEFLVCPDDDGCAAAKAPPRIVEKGVLGDRLLVETVANKFLLHQPIERQATHWQQQQGFPIDATTLGRSVNATRSSR